MPMRDAARAACLSHAFLRSWRCHPNLSLDWSTLFSSRHLRKLSCQIDDILGKHSGVGVKILKLNLSDDYIDFPHVDSWLQVAVTLGIEELTLWLYKKYNFTCSVLSDGVRNSIRYLNLSHCTFRPTVELGPLRSLTNLRLSSVRITGDELECLLFNSLALEQLYLYECKEIIFLKIPCVLKQLKYMGVINCRMVQVIENKTTNLSRISICGGKMKLSLGEVSQMKYLHITCPNAICYARAELPSIMPNLETLELCSEAEVVNTPMLPTKFLDLKHLAIYISWSRTDFPNYDYFSLVSFVDASPYLETLLLSLFEGHMEHEPNNNMPEHRHDRLKSVKITGLCSAKSLIELTYCIAKNTTSLECLVLDTLPHDNRCSGENNKICWSFRKSVLDEAFRTVAAIRTYIQDKVSPTAKLTVLEPCTRCHSVDRSLKLQPC